MKFPSLPEQRPNPYEAIQANEVRYRSRVSMPSHYHDEACLVLLSSGSVRHAEHRQTVQLWSGSVVYLPPAERHADVFGYGGATAF
jgi:quercetin dioxygenase-like cupin family protein